MPISQELGAKLILNSLSTSLSILIIYFALRSLIQKISTRKIILYVTALILTLFIPLYYLISKKAFSSVELMIFTTGKELLTSIVFLIVFFLTWMLLYRSDRLSHPIEIVIQALDILFTIRQSRSVSKSVFVILTPTNSLDFFAKWYWYIKKAIGMKRLHLLLKYCHIGINYPPAETEFLLYYSDNLEEIRFISSEESVRIVSSEDLTLLSFDESEAIREIKRNLHRDGEA